MTQKSLCVLSNTLLNWSECVPLNFLLVLLLFDKNKITKGQQVTLHQLEREARPRV